MTIADAGAVPPASAATDRAMLAALGRDLSRAGGLERGEALVASRPVPPADFRDLRAAPAWLRRSPEALRDLARRASLQSTATTLAASIDGTLLGRVAQACGEGALDAAISGARSGDDRPIPDADAIEADGLTLLAAVLPQALRAYLPTGCTDVVPFSDASRARDWVERVAGEGA